MPALVITIVGRFVSTNWIATVSTPSIVLMPLRLNENRDRLAGRKKNSVAVGTLKLRLTGPMLYRALSSEMRLASLASPLTSASSRCSRSPRLATAWPFTSMTSRNPTQPIESATFTIANSAVRFRGG